MKRLLFTLFFFSVAAFTIAHAKVWIGKDYQWSNDSNTAVRYAPVSQADHELIQVEEFMQNRQKTDIWHFSNYTKNPQRRIKEGIHKVFYANGKDRLVNTTPVVFRLPKS